MPNEADTCRRYVVPLLQAAGWDADPHRINEQVTFTDGRIVVTGQRGRRRPGKRADYILRYRPDLAIAVVVAWFATNARVISWWAAEIESASRAPT